MTHEDLIAYQQKAERENKERLEQKLESKQEYFNSEDFKRDSHNHYEELWERKAKREGWKYTPAVYVSEAEKKAESERSRKREIEQLKTRLKELLTDQEKDVLYANLKSSQL